MIVPNTILRQRRLKDVRALMLQYRIRLLADLGEDVFYGVVAPSSVFVTERRAPNKDDSVLMVSVNQVPSLEKSEALPKATSTAAEVKEFYFLQNADLEFMESTKKCTAPAINLGEFVELECKDAGINYQRVSVGMQEKGKSDLSDRLLYDGSREKPEDMMYWKGSDIDRYWIAPKMSRLSDKLQKLYPG